MIQIGKIVLALASRNVRLWLREVLQLARSSSPVKMEPAFIYFTTVLINAVEITF